MNLQFVKNNVNKQLLTANTDIFISEGDKLGFIFKGNSVSKDSEAVLTLFNKNFKNEGGAKKKGIVYNKVSDRKYTDKDGVKRTLYEKKGVYYVKRKNVHGKMTYKKVTIK